MHFSHQTLLTFPFPSPLFGQCNCTQFEKIEQNLIEFSFWPQKSGINDDEFSMANEFRLTFILSHKNIHFSLHQSEEKNLFTHTCAKKVANQLLKFMTEFGPLILYTLSSAKWSQQIENDQLVS